MTGFAHPFQILGLIPVLPRFFAATSAAPLATSHHPETSMLTTITLADRTTAQGLAVTEHADGRVTVETGRAQLTGWPMPRAAR